MHCARRFGFVLSLSLLPLACDAPPQPIAIAGTARTVAVRQLVQLDGSGSMTRDTQPGASISRYGWSILSLPSGSVAALDHPDIARPSFTPDLVGDYQLRLTVSDANGVAAATVTITAVACAPVIATPTANPAAPNVGDDVTLGAAVQDAAACDAMGTTMVTHTFSYAWSIAGLPPGSRATLEPSAGGESDAAAPVFRADIAGDFLFNLRVTDELGRFATAGFKVTVGNCGDNPPTVTAIVATPAMPNTGDIVQLTANVTDPDTDPMGTCKRTQSISWAWTLIGSPQGSAATLSAGDTATPWLRPDVNGLYTIRLIVTDSTGLASPAKDFPLTVADCGSKLPVITQITPSTLTPFLGQQVNLAATVTDDNTLMGCGRLETFDYAWTLVQQPAQSLARLQNATSATPSFIPDVTGNYLVQLTVTDSDGHVGAPRQSAPIVAGTCGLSAPVAQIGIDSPFVIAAPATPPPAIALQMPTGVPLQLDATTSSDPDNSKQCMLPNPQGLSYQWRFEQLPVGSHSTFNDSRTVSPSFTPDMPGPYIINLTVTDTTGLVGTARVEVNGFNAAQTVAWGVGPYTSLALDGTDPRIAYYDKNRAGAFIAACTGPSCQTSPLWSINTIELGGNVGRMISLAASGGTLYAVYWDAANCQPRYAVSTDTGKTWLTSTLQAGNNQSCFTNFNCAPFGCMNRNAVDWRDNGAFPTIAISPASGNPVVAFVGYVQGPAQGAMNNMYVGPGFDEVRMAACTANCKTANPTWVITSAGSGTNANNARAGYTSIAFDPTSKLPSITFRTNDFAGGNGREAVGYIACTAGCETNNPTFAAVAWIDLNHGFDAYTPTQINAETSYNPLAFSSTGQPSVAVSDSKNQWLRYTSCAKVCSTAASWSGLVLDASGSVGQYASLALSPLQATLDRPRVAYLNTTGTSLRLATQQGDGSWALTDLDKSSGFVSLKLSATDGPRVSHFNGNAVRFFTSGN